MRTFACLVVIAGFGCGKNPDVPAAVGSNAPIAPGSAAATQDAATVNEVLMRLSGEVASDAEIDRGYAVLATRSEKRCPTKRAFPNSSDTDARNASKELLIGISCGVPDGTWLVGATNNAATPPLLYGAKVVDKAARVLVDDLFTSDTRVCVGYSIRRADRKTSGYVHCMPSKGGAPFEDADPPVVEKLAPVPFAPTTEPLTSEAQSVLAHQSSKLCTAGDLAHATSIVAKDGEVEVLGSACSDPKLRKFEVGLLVRGGGGLSTAAFTRAIETDTITFTGVSSSANELCIEFTANPANSSDRLCMRRKR